jgi:hypothetical protein
MAKRTKLILVSVVVAVLLALASSAALPGRVALVEVDSPGTMEIAGPIRGGGSYS